MDNVRVISMRAETPPGFARIDVTSHNTTIGRVLSPFWLGPVPCYAEAGTMLRSRNVENAWQYAKLYARHLGDDLVSPGPDYFTWRDQGWAKIRADRRPMGRERPTCSIWREADGMIVQLGYIEARKRIYLPLYRDAVLAGSSIISDLKRSLSQGSAFALADFDGYDHKAAGMTYDQVINDPSRPMGHAFVIAMLLEGLI